MKSLPFSKSLSGKSSPVNSEMLKLISNTISSLQVTPPGRSISPDGPGVLKRQGSSSRGISTASDSSSPELLRRESIGSKEHKSMKVAESATPRAQTSQATPIKQVSAPVASGATIPSPDLTIGMGETLPTTSKQLLKTPQLLPTRSIIESGTSCGNESAGAVQEKESSVSTGVVSVEKPLSRGPICSAPLVPFNAPPANNVLTPSASADYPTSASIQQINASSTQPSNALVAQPPIVSYAQPLTASPFTTLVSNTDSPVISGMFNNEVGIRLDKRFSNNDNQSKTKSIFPFNLLSF